MTENNKDKNPEKNKNYIEGSIKLNELIEKIRKGKITKKELESTLNELEKKVNIPYTIANVDKKEKPWDKKYLEEYYNRIKNGQSSKECILYFAEVADYVYDKDSIKGKITNFKYKKYVKDTLHNSVYALVSDIKDGKIKYEDVKKVVNEIDKKFNEFIDVSIKEIEKPWGYNVLKKYLNFIITTPASKNDILHMAEIADVVYGKSRDKEQIKIDINKYIIDNGKISRTGISSDVKYGKLTREDIIELCKDKRLRDNFIGKTMPDKLKKSKEEWDKNYLETLSCASAGEVFNEEYLLYFLEVSNYVNGSNKKKKIIDKSSDIKSIKSYKNILNPSFSESGNIEKVLGSTEPSYDISIDDINSKKKDMIDNIDKIFNEVKSNKNKIISMQTKYKNPPSDLTPEKVDEFKKDIDNQINNMKEHNKALLAYCKEVSKILRMFIY